MRTVLIAIGIVVVGLTSAACSTSKPAKASEASTSVGPSVSPPGATVGGASAADRGSSGATTGSVTSSSASEPGAAAGASLANFKCPTTSVISTDMGATATPGSEDGYVAANQNLECQYDVDSYDLMITLAALPSGMTLSSLAAQVGDTEGGQQGTVESGVGDQAEFFPPLAGLGGGEDLVVVAGRYGLDTEAESPATESQLATVTQAVINLNIP
jgi:hypothetical protein